MQRTRGVIVGIGIDLVEVARIEGALLRHGSRFERRIFTGREIEDCAGRADRSQALAARFAAKEACLKALGTGWAAGLAFGQIELRREPGRAPRLELRGAAAERARALGIVALHVSISHQPSTAAAVVVLEGGATVRRAPTP